MDKDFWNQRFGTQEYVYGTQPNEYLKDKLSDISAGKILMVADGEGRNGVYAARLGWSVYAFDQSLAGKQKALLLAEKNNTAIEYKVSDVESVSYPANFFDAVAFIYAHFPEEKRRKWHQKIVTFLKPGGFLILEGFSKNHVRNQKINPRAGGPKNPAFLFDLQEIKEDFQDFKFSEAEEVSAVLSEGEYHSGSADVIRIFAVKR